MMENLKKFSWIKIRFFAKKLQFTVLVLGIQKAKRTSKMRKSSSLNKEHTALQNMKISKKFSSFVGHFSPPRSGSGF
jgi:chromatin remodeling complex protein RSC6